MGDLLVLWDVDGTLLNAGGVGGDLYEMVFAQLFGCSLEAFAPMAAIDTLYLLAPAFSAFTALAAFSVIPWGEGWHIWHYLLKDSQ